MPTAPVFCLVAGEASGDNLGAPLIQALKQRYPNARFLGIGGDRMIAAGLEPWCHLDKLSVNGFVEPLKRLPELLGILLTARDKTLQSQPACFIGIDFNFFNLLLEGMLKKRGVNVVHYVSPTVWAWRKGRIKGIKKKVDLMLALYPFETQIYKDHGIDVEFVGHPKADEIAPGDHPERTEAARHALGVRSDSRVLALLPGSRGSEVVYSGPEFIEAARRLVEKFPDLKVFIPAANEKRKAQIEEMLSGFSASVSVGNALEIMSAADVVLVNSGTATLEAMLLKKPMVMSYRLGSVTYWIVSKLVQTQFFALPNILSGEKLVPELIQEDASPEALAKALEQLLVAAGHGALMERFEQIHLQLRKDSGESAAKAISQLIEGQRVRV